MKLSFICSNRGVTPEQLDVTKKLLHQLHPSEIHHSSYKNEYTLYKIMEDYIIKHGIKVNTHFLKGEDSQVFARDSESKEDNDPYTRVNNLIESGNTIVMLMHNKRIVNDNLVLKARNILKTKKKKQVICVYHDGTTERHTDLR